MDVKQISEALSAEPGFSSNLRRLREGRGWSRRQVAERLSTVLKREIHQQTVKDYEGRNQSMPDELLDAFAQVYDVPRGKIMEPGAIEEAGRVTSATEEHYRALERATRDPELVYVPFLNVTASAGGGYLNEEYETPHTFLAFGKKWIEGEIGNRHPHAAAIKIKGNSMEPLLRAGDVVLVDRTIKKPEPGDVMIVWTPADGLKVKRAEKREGVWWAVSENREATDEPIDFETDEASFRGRVFWRGGNVT